MFNATQATQVRYPQHRKQNSETDTAQQKQRKQPGRFQPIQRLQPNFTTDSIANFMAQQKQRKQLILTDGKNILLTLSNRYNKSHGATETMQTTHFYRRKEYFYLLFPINATLTPNYKTDGIRSLKYTKRNGDNAILRIFSFIPQ